MKGKAVHPKLRINREAIAVLVGRELDRVAGGGDNDRVHCCSQWTKGEGPSTTSSSILM